MNLLLPDYGIIRFQYSAKQDRLIALGFDRGYQVCLLIFTASFELERAQQLYLFVSQSLVDETFSPTQIENEERLQVYQEAKVSDLSTRTIQTIENLYDMSIEEEQELILLSFKKRKITIKGSKREPEDLAVCSKKWHNLVCTFEGRILGQKAYPSDQEAQHQSAFFWFEANNQSKRS